MARDDGSFLKGKVPAIDARQKKLFNRAVQIARSRRHRQEVRSGSHLQIVQWRARYRGLVVQLTYTVFRTSGATDMAVRVRRERKEVFHLACRKTPTKDRARGGKNAVTVYNDEPGDWERSLEGKD